MDDQESTHLLDEISPEAILNEGNSGREEIGDCRTRNGETFIYVKGGKFCKVANFLMTITHHGTLEDQSEAYILTCTKKDNSVFIVPVNLSDLDSFAKLYNKFLKHRPSDTTILQDIGRRGKVHRHIDTLIRKYMNCDEKNEVFLVERYGFHNTTPDLPPIFVVGKELAIIASNDAGQMDKEVMWIGPKTVKNCKVGPPLSLDQTTKLLQQLQHYHGPNFGSILLLLSFTKVSVHRHQLLEQCGIHMPLVHVVGDISTGKSHAGEHLRCIFPYTVATNGSAHVTRDDNSTETVVYDELGKSGPPLLYDPALNFPAPVMNTLSDNIYQGVLHRTKHTTGNGLKVQRGLIQIHPNENANLRGLLPTALSKSVISIHERQLDPDLDSMERNHQEIVNDFETSSGLFHFMVFPLDYTNLMAMKTEFASRLTKDLQGTVSKNLLSSSSRAIDNYALLMGGMNCLTSDMGLTIEASEKLQSELYSHILQKCLPKTLSSIEAATSSKGKISALASKEVLIQEMVANLKDLTFKEFFQKIFLSKTSVYICKDIFVKSTSHVMKEAQVFVEAQFPISRCFFLASDSDAVWFKRSKNKLDTRDSYCIYGNSSKKYGYVMPLATAWPELIDMILRKAKEVVPGLGPNTNSKDIYKLMSTHFDRVYQKDGLANEGDKETFLVDLYAALPTDKKKKFLQGVKLLFEELQADKDPSSDVQISSNDQQSENEEQLKGCREQLPIQGGSPEQSSSLPESSLLNASRKEDQLIQAEPSKQSDILHSNSKLPTLPQETEVLEATSSESTCAEPAMDSQDLELGDEKGSPNLAFIFHAADENGNTSAPQEKEESIRLGKRGSKNTSSKSTRASLRSKRKRN